jgi:DNA helicase HerA-like ATPase
MFRNALQKRMSESSSQEDPDLADLVKTVEAYPLRSAYDNETKVALLRRLAPLTQGQAGKALVGGGRVGMEDLLSSPVCLELGYLRDIQTRTVFADVVLKLVYEARVREKSGLAHLTVVEEARNVAPARRAEDPPSVGERMISELRKFGEALMFVAQFPSQVAAEVVRNSGTKIVHRVDWPEDVAVIGESLGLDDRQREHLSKLKTGEVVVSLERIRSPVMVEVRSPYRGGDRRDASFEGER